LGRPDWLSILAAIFPGRGRGLRAEGVAVIDRLFVYGTLAPGGPNAHILADLSGTWEPAMVRGKLLERGWGADLGFPGLVVDELGVDVTGMLLRSPQLVAHWGRLDEFEGEGYERVAVPVTLLAGGSCVAYVYALR